jgi:phospholipase/lecithinase/hemolysin
MSQSRRSFRPSVRAGETLEERVMLSHAGVTAGTVASATGHLASARRLLAHGHTPPSLGPVGAVGDSYTDEYEFYPPDRTTARNWVEILHALRGVRFGPFTTRSRGEPRDQGFANNWARSDATSVDMIRNQLPGLAAQVAAGEIRYAWVFIGGNDYLDALAGVAAGTTPPSAVPTLIAQVESQDDKNFTTAVETLLAANPRVDVVVATLPDISLTPIAREAMATPQGQALVAAVSDSIQRYDAVIAAAAEDPRVTLVDLAAATAPLASNTTGTATFGGTTVNLVTPGDDYHDFYLADGVHLGTIGQSFIANLFAEAIDSKFGAHLKPISPREVVRYAKEVQRHAEHGAG